MLGWQRWEVRLLDEKGDLLIKVRWKGLLVKKASSSVIFTSKARTPAAGDSAQVDLDWIGQCVGCRGDILPTSDYQSKAEPVTFL